MVPSSASGPRAEGDRVTAQLAMPLRAPARDRQESITAEVLRVLEERGGEPISQAALAERVRYRLALDHLSATTMARRSKESISALVDRGHHVCSDHRGYWLGTSAQDIEAGERYLRRQLVSLARRYRRFNLTTASALLEALGQGRVIS